MTLLWQSKFLEGTVDDEENSCWHNWLGTIAEAAHIPSYTKRDDVEIKAFIDRELERVSSAADKLTQSTGRSRPRVYPSLTACLEHERLDAGGLSLDPLRVYSSSYNVLTSTELSAGVGPLFDREIAHFIECVKSGMKPCSDVGQGRDIVEMLTGIARSSEFRKEVML